MYILPYASKETFVLVVLLPGTMITFQVNPFLTMTKIATKIAPLKLLKKSPV